MVLSYFESINKNLIVCIIYKIIYDSPKVM
jgi:hypothetical protein